MPPPMSLGSKSRISRQMSEYPQCPDASPNVPRFKIPNIQTNLNIQTSLNIQMFEFPNILRFKIPNIQTNLNIQMFEFPNILMDIPMSRCLPQCPEYPDKSEYPDV